MQRITLLCVGSLKTSWVKEGISQYVDRLKPVLQFTVEEVPAGKSTDAAKQRQEENAALLKALDRLEGAVHVLDETGTPKTSQEFAKDIANAKDRGEKLIFVVGGAYGLTPAVKQKGKLLRLSTMTFPHELCRLVFMEQLYRATQILSGSGYHH